MPLLIQTARQIFVTVFVLSLLLSGCGGGGSSSGSHSGSSSAGAPDSIRGYTLTMQIEEVDVIHNGGARFLDPGDKVVMGFVDENTVYGDDKFNNKLNIDSWDYTLTGKEGVLNLNQSSAEHTMTFRFSSSNTGTYTWESHAYMSGSRVRYSGSFDIESHTDDDSSADDSNGAGGSADNSALQGRWTGACEYGYRLTWEFSGDSLHYSPTYYDTENCSDAGYHSPAEVTASYWLGEEVITESGLKARQIRITYASVKYPDDFDISPGDTSHQLVYVDGNKLYFGGIELGKSTSYPTSLNIINPYQKR